MAWSAVRVRPATTQDLPTLLALGEELREQVLPISDPAPRSRAGKSRSLTTRAVLESRYLEAIADPARHLVLAVGDRDEVLGMAIFSVASANALLDLPAVHVSHAVVSDRHKRRGAGKALVAAAAAFAEERGLDQLLVSVHPGSREANRFFARLGFAPLAVRRVASVGVVRRRLAGPHLSAVDAVVRRRTRRVPAAPAPATPAPATPAAPVTAHQPREVEIPAQSVPAPELPVGAQEPDSTIVD